VSSLALSLILALSTIASPGPPLDPTKPPPPPIHSIAEVPLVERNTNWCGPAALAAVLQYHREQISAKEIADEVYLPEYRGSLNLDLLVYARKRGFKVSAGAGTAGKMKQAVAQDRPVICMVRRGNVVARRNHYVVVRGYDSERGVWFLDSGNGEEEMFANADFEREWRECGHWMLVVEGKEMTAATPGSADEGG